MWSRLFQELIVWIYRRIAPGYGIAYCRAGVALDMLAGACPLSTTCPVS
jgi:hypothetical protein